MKIKLIAVFSLVTPVVAMAQNLGTTITNLGGWVSSLIPIAFSAALLFFFYGLAMFMLKAGEEKQKGRDIMIWGVIALFVMTSIFGIVRFIGTSIGVSDTGSNFTVPTVNSGGSRAPGPR